MKRILFILKNKQKAGALSYVTGLSLLIFMLLMIPFVLNHYGYNEINRLNKRLQLNDNLNSVINLLELGQYSLDTDLKHNIVIFEDEPPINCFVEKWGLFDLVHLHTHSVGFTDTLIILTSERILAKDSLCLYMADHGNYLSVTGNTAVEGKCYLPALGITKAYIEGIHYASDTIVYGNIDTASASLPELKRDIEERFLKIFSSQQGDLNRIPDSLCNDYIKPELQYHSNDDIYIDQYIKGKVLISSNSTITISEDAELDGCIIAASHIIIQDNFKGRLQMFARDSIVINNNCKLLYPTVLFVNKGSDVSIKIGEENFICGAIILNNNETDDCLLEIEDKTIVEGQVYNKGTTSIRGNIWGEIHTNHFLYTTQYSTYDDLLFNITISKKKMSPDFVGLNLFENVNSKISIACFLN